MTQFITDLRFALRVLLKNPALTVPAIFVLAIGLGATTAVFSVVDHVLFRPLAVPEADRLVTICESHPSRGGDYCTASTPNVMDWAARTRAFSALGAGRSWPYFVNSDGRPRTMNFGIATPGFLEAIGLKPIAGRLIEASDVPPSGTGRVVVLSYEMWQSHFGGVPDVLGRSLSLDDQPYMVIGILPPGTQVPRVPEARAWLPLPWSPRDENRRDWRGFVAAGRLQPNATRAQAETELRSVQRALEETYPKQLRDWRVDVLSMQDRIVGGVRRMLLAFLAAVVLVLLLVCVNVAALLLTRATGREREIAVRYAMGARTGQVLRQLLAESTVLAVIGGLAGALVAVWTIEAFVALAPPEIPRINEVKVDGRVLGFAFLISLIAAIVSGVVPGLRMCRVDAGQALRAGRAESGGRRASRTRQVLVAAELAIALTLVTGAGLLLQSFVGLLQWQPGFDPNRIVTFPVFVPKAKYSTQDQIRDLYRRAEQALAALPGVESVSTASAGPLFGGGDGEARYVVEGSSSSSAEQAVAWFDVGPTYFPTLGLPLVRGRMFNEQDFGNPDVPVVLVNETMARRWPDANPIGARIRLIELGNSVVEIIGVVSDVPPFDPGAVPTAQLYFTNRQYTRLATFFILRTVGNASNIKEAAEARITEIDPALQPSSVTLLSDRVGRELVRPRFNLLLIGLFAVIAVLIGIVGVYGLIAYSVDMRSREIGIRLALGGRPQQIAWSVLREATSLCAIGAVAGIGGALVFGRLLRGILQGVSPTDPAAFASAVAILIVCGIAAAIVPAVRAARTDPVSSLRVE